MAEKALDWTPVGPTERLRSKFEEVGASLACGSDIRAMQKISEEEELEHEREIPLKALTAPDEDENEGVEMNVDLMAERELQDYDWALGYGSAPYACGNVMIQLTDITFHVLMNQTEALHIVANCVIIVWAVNFLYNYIEISRWRTVGFSVMLTYIVLMISFFGTAGFSNDRGQVRAMGLTFFVTTLVASGVTQMSLRKIRPDDPPEWRDALIL